MRQLVRTGRWLGAVSLALAATAAEAQPAATERPTYSTGQQWILTDGVYDLVRVESDGYVFAASPSRQIQLSRDLVVTRVVKDSVVEWELYPVASLPWPLQEGKWGTFRSTLRTRDHRSGINVTVTWRVKGLTDVTTAAGTFKALPIEQRIEAEDTERRGRLGVSGRLRWDVVAYYAPAARSLVKVEASGVDALNLQLAAWEGRESRITLILNEPKDQARVSSERLAVEGRASAPNGIARLSLAVNGAELVNRRPATRQNEMPVSLTVSLREGRNVVVLSVEDGTGAAREERRVVVYEKATAAAPPPADRPAPTPAPQGEPARAARPMSITVTTPADQARVEQDSITLNGVAASGRGVTRVVVAVNGVEVKRLEEPSPQPRFPITVPLLLKEGSNTLVVSATDAGGAIRQEVRTIVYEKAAPLAVDVRYPEDRARVTDASSLVAAVVSSSKGVTNVTVSLNGTSLPVPKTERAEPASPRSVAVTVPITLREGPNAIVITATDAAGEVRHEVRTVVYERPAAPGPVPAPGPEPAPPATDRWAVVIGVGRYERAEITSLQYTVADAESVHDTLVARGGFKKENVLLMTDRTEKKPTLRNIKWALGTFLARSAKPEDLVVIYFSGHGAPEIDPRGVESDGLAKYLVPSDADPGDLYSTALPMDELQTIFERIEAKRVVVLLDSCYSGAAGGRTFASRRTRNTRVDDLFLDRLTRSSGRVIITAARSAEVSMELPELGHGIFTHYLLQGLQGPADLDRDGIIALQELYQYLEQQVSQKSRAAGGNQHPVMKGEVEGILPLMKVSGRGADR